MRIILIRHGEPNYEFDCLTELGHKQAKVAAERLLKENIDEVFSSPLGRAAQTADYFSKASGKKVQTLDFIKEIRYGQEGKLYDDTWNPWNLADKIMWDGKDLQNPDWRNHPEFKENFATKDADKIAVETDKWLSTLGYKRDGFYYRNTLPNEDPKTLAIFCHGGASTAFLARVLNLPFPYLCALLHFSYTGITVLRFDKKPKSLSMPILELLNDDRHLNNVVE